MSSTQRIFISAVSAELGESRRAVRDILTTRGILPVVQDNFPPDYRAVKDVLRSAIESCDAVICLIGQQYGREPKNREASEPRRSYTQLEYDVARELNKPIFLFTYRGDPERNDAPAESGELQSLQLAHLQRIAEIDQIRLPFASQTELRELVSLTNFDKSVEDVERDIRRSTAVLLHASIPQPASGVDTENWIASVAQPWQASVRKVRQEFAGDVHSESAGMCVLRFTNAKAAVNAALTLQHRTSDGETSRCRIAVHSGEILEFRGVSLSSALNISNAADLCASLNELSQPGQILLTRQPFDESRQSIAEHPVAGSDSLTWHAHGRYLMRNALTAGDSFEEAFDVFEVGCKISQPADTERLWSSETEEQERMRGWRPSIGKPIPTQDSWIIKRKLGEGGFGEAWLAEQKETRRQQVFKFCFDLERLRSFRRELTVFRLLQKELGDRNDIARLEEAQTDTPPFYLKSEYVEAGNLEDWADGQGGLESIPLDERLRITQEICAAVAAAHSKGVFHRDLKPTNIFMRQDASGVWHPVLADFGIGALADSSLLKKHDITHGSLMQTMLIGSSRVSGSRMYKPPEADTGEHRGTTQADVYALGVMLFQMVTADFKRPAGIGWEQYLPCSIQTAETSEKDNGPDQHVWAELLRGDIRSAIHVDPAQRLGSVDSLLERLKSLPDRTYAEAARRATERIQRRNRRLRNLLTVAAVSLLIVGGLSIFSLLQWKNATSANERIVEINKDLKVANQDLSDANDDITRQNTEISGLNQSLEQKIEEASAERDEKERQRSLAARRLFQMQLGNAEAARRLDNIPLQLAWLKSAIEVAGDDIDEHERSNIRERAALAELRSPVLERTLKVEGPLVRIATDLHGRFVAAYSRLSPNIGPVVIDATTGKRVLGPLPNRNATPAQFVAIDDAGSKLAYAYGSAVDSNSTLVFWSLIDGRPVGRPVTLAGEITKLWFAEGNNNRVRAICVNESDDTDEIMARSSEVTVFEIDVAANQTTSKNSIVSPGEVFRILPARAANHVLICFMPKPSPTTRFQWHKIVFSDDITKAPVTEVLKELDGTQAANFSGDSAAEVAFLSSNGQLKLLRDKVVIDTQVLLPANTGHFAVIPRGRYSTLIAVPESLTSESQVQSEAGDFTQLQVISPQLGGLGDGGAPRFESAPVQIVGYPVSFTSLSTSGDLFAEYAIGTNTGQTYFGMDSNSQRGAAFSPVHHNSPIIAVRALAGGARVLTASADGRICIWALRKSDLRRQVAASVQRLKLEAPATTEIWSGDPEAKVHPRRLDLIGHFSRNGLWYLPRDGDRTASVFRGTSEEVSNRPTGIQLPPDVDPMSGTAIGKAKSLLFTSSAIPRHPTELITVAARQVRPEIIPQLLQMTFRGESTSRIALVDHDERTVSVLVESLPGPPLRAWSPSDGICVIVGNASNGETGFAARLVFHGPEPEVTILETPPMLDVVGNGERVFAISGNSQLLRIDAAMSPPGLVGSPQLGSLHGLHSSADAKVVVAWSEDEIFRTEFDNRDVIKATCPFGSVREARLVPEKETFVAYSDEGHLGLFDLKTLQSVRTVKIDTEIEGIAVASDGQSFVLAEETPFLSDKERQRALGFSMDRRRWLRHFTISDFSEIAFDLSSVADVPSRESTLAGFASETALLLLQGVPVRHLHWSPDGRFLFVVNGRRAQILSPEIFPPSTVLEVPMESLRSHSLEVASIHISPRTLEPVHDDVELHAADERAAELLARVRADEPLNEQDSDLLSEYLLDKRDFSGCWEVADYLYFRRRYESSALLYGFAYSLQPDNIPNAIRYARCLIQFAPEDAIGILKPLTEQSLDDEIQNDGYLHAAQAQLANANASLGRWDEAGKAFDRHIEVPLFARVFSDPGTANNVLARGVYVAQRNDENEKVDRYVNLMLSAARTSKNSEAWANLAEHLHLIRGRVGVEELVEVSKLLTKERPNSAGRIMIAREFAERGLTQEAVDLLSQIRAECDADKEATRFMPEYLILAVEFVLTEQNGDSTKASRLRTESLEKWRGRLGQSKYKGLPSYTSAEILSKLLDVELAPVAKPDTTSEISDALELPVVKIQTVESAQEHIIKVAEHYLNRRRLDVAISSLQSMENVAPNDSLSDSLRGRIVWIWARAIWALHVGNDL